MLDARLWIIVTMLVSDSRYPIKHYVSLYPRSRGNFFKAKALLENDGIVSNLDDRRGYMDIDEHKALAFLEAEYPGLPDMIDNIKRARVASARRMKL